MSVPDPTLDAASCTAIWRSVLPTRQELRSARRRLHGKALVIAALLASSYVVIVIAEFALVLRMAAALVLVTALVALGTSVMHDANHGAFSRFRWINRTLSYTSDALGASSWLWRIQHNTLHHANTNIEGFDADLELAPWARLTPRQPWRPRFRWQHIYIWPLYGFLSVKNLLVSDVSTLISGRIGDQPLRRRPGPLVIMRVVLGKLAHLSWAIVVPLLFNPWWTVLLFYVVCSWLVGFLLAIIFQLAHCVDAAEIHGPETPRRGEDFTAHQLRTTVNIASPMPVVGHFFRWLAGGLDHQIEHHLAPGLPHTIYPRLAARFREACHANGIEYRSHAGLWPAICSHTRWLRAMGRPLPLAIASGSGATRSAT
jgi:linoleoyl-CoA desaturase